MNEQLLNQCAAACREAAASQALADSMVLEMAKSVQRGDPMSIYQNHQQHAEDAHEIAERHARMTTLALTGLAVGPNKIEAGNVHRAAVLVYGAWLNAHDKMYRAAQAALEEAAEHILSTAAIARRVA